MKPLLCIYHGNCADGFGAAWVVRRFCNLNGIEVEFFPGVYQNPPPDVTGRHVLFVDFSYKRQVIREMEAQALSILILDHHKTAMEDLHEFDKVINWRAEDVAKTIWSADGVTVPTVWTKFDLERSGAGIAWDFFFPNEQRPPLINHIEDRDLWRFALLGTREIQAAIFSYPYDFEVWDRLFARNPKGLDELYIEGKAIERKHFKDIYELIEVVTIPIEIGGTVVPCANLPYTLTSDAGHALCERSWEGHGLPEGAKPQPFAACFWLTPEGVVFSLRSRDDGADVGEIAKEYGGGGHKHASGFRVSFTEFADMLR